MMAAVRKGRVARYMIMTKHETPDAHPGMVSTFGCDESADVEVDEYRRRQALPRSAGRTSLNHDLEKMLETFSHKSFFAQLGAEMLRYAEAHPERDHRAMSAVHAAIEANYSACPMAIKCLLSEPTCVDCLARKSKVLAGA